MRRRPELDPRLARGIVAMLLVALPFVGGCDEDSGDETFETPNEVDGSPSDSEPAGDVDSRDDGTPDGS